MARQSHSKRNAHAIAIAVTKENLVKKITLAFLALLIGFGVVIASSNAFADNKDPKEQLEAYNFIEKLSVQALGYLQDETLSAQELKVNFKDMLTTSFSMKYMSKMSLGRYRKKATKEELSKYYALYPDYLVSYYLNAFQNTVELTAISVKKVVPFGKKSIIVRTTATIGSGKTADLDWNIQRSKKTGQYLIKNVIVKGISQLQFIKDDFAAIIEKSDFNGLTTFMTKFISDETLIKDPKSIATK